VRRRIPALLALLALLVALTSGCFAPSDVKPAHIDPEPHASGDDQCGMFGETLERPLRVIVHGKRIPGLFGGKGTEPPAPGAEVRFVVENPESGAVFADTDLPETTAVTDAAGVAAASLRLGDLPGDVFVTASVDTEAGPVSYRFRALAGVEKFQPILEGPTGAVIPSVGLTFFDAPGQPAEGIVVHFAIEGNGDGAKISQSYVTTGHDGRAFISWTLGDHSKQYFLKASIRDLREAPPGGAPFIAFPVEFEAMGLNKLGIAFEVFGGLAVFIFGMRLMSGGLRRLADRRLKSILQAVTSNRFFAVGAGALMTGMVQSSSASTVMVIGFVNAGLMTLAQAVGVMFGANIGTTLTAQIIAFRLDALAYPAIAAGLLAVSLSRRPAIRALGESIMGFGLLFLGMTTMSGVLEPLRYSPEFQAFFQIFDCTPVNGVIPWRSALMCIVIGTVMTLVVQSSSATIGIVLALSGQGLLSFYTAVPLVFGDNIGTTITAFLASLGGNRNSKRAAVAHILFNVTGSAYMYALLFLPLWNGEPIFLGLVDAITPGDAFSPSPENLPRHVANAHTAFNLINCLLFLPFLHHVVRFCEWVIPRSAADKEVVMAYLEPHLLTTPSVALDQAVREVSFMLERAKKCVDEAAAFFGGGSSDYAESVRRREKTIDRLQKEITAYLVDLSRQDLTPDESALIPVLVHAVNDVERIGDYSEDLVELAEQRRRQDLALTQEAQQDLLELDQLIRDQFEAALDALNTRSVERADDVKMGERRLTELAQRMYDAHVDRLEEDRCTVPSGVLFFDYINHMERIGDHLVSVAKRVKKIARVTM